MSDSHFYVLNARERRALRALELSPDDFKPEHAFGRSVGPKTIELLVSLGLIEEGRLHPSRGTPGWRLTDDGWRCMYGRTLKEIQASGDTNVRSLKVWRWPLPTR